ncbi:interferon-inducible GTPase 5-like [Chanos chanos]|uniref:Interferon-inducible GTPase 5-like n=1 Tax=Chanos chanos TaxID=29144 RepID=A0A6J2WHA2_CHACN|nr:interferon-inducible GTPase 5-like [Chanos chanos]
MAGMENGFDIIGDTELHEIKEALATQDLPTLIGNIQNYFEQLDRVELNIAVTGESGSGKSTFINSFRGLGDEEDNSAPTGVVETTKEPKDYPYPKYPNVKLWDLPGIGTPNFKADEYLENVHFERYDFFIIVASDRFREYHVELASQITKMNKRFCFVRSKIDNSIRAERRKKNFNEEKTMNDIREDCTKGLSEFDVDSPQVFLISSFEPTSYNFSLLQETILKELPQHKGHVLLLALGNITMENFERKRKALEASLWKVSLLSAGAAVMPVPGLSISVDVAFIVKELRRYYSTFGLDDQSLQRLSHKSERSVEELKSKLKSSLSKGINDDAVIKMLSRAAGLVRKSAVDHHVSLIPGLGSLVAGALSFSAVYYVLQRCLRELEEDAKNLLKIELETPV